MNKSFEFYLKNRLKNIKDYRLKETLYYAIEEGKRFRPELIFSIVKGFNLPEKIAYSYALALEMIHSYSLVHDDLPSMDNADLRRGKLTVHKKYSEIDAILTGDALLTHSFLIAASAKRSVKEKLAVIKELSYHSGINGMIYGQSLDTDNYLIENETEIHKIEDFKTGALFKCSLLIGMHIVKDYKNRKFYEKLGILIGRIFQMQDDLFDVTRSKEETGKTADNDIKNNRNTILNFYSVDELKEIIAIEFSKVYKLLENQKFDISYLKEIIYKMEHR